MPSYCELEPMPPFQSLQLPACRIQLHRSEFVTTMWMVAGLCRVVHAPERRSSGTIPIQWHLLRNRQLLAAWHAKQYLPMATEQLMNSVTLSEEGDYRCASGEKLHPLPKEGLLPVRR